MAWRKPKRGLGPAREDRSGDGEPDLGDGGSVQSRRLRCCASLILCQRGAAVWRHASQRRGVFQSPEGAAFLRAGAPGGRTLFRDVSEGGAETVAKKCVGHVVSARSRSSSQGALLDNSRKEPT